MRARKRIPRLTEEAGKEEGAQRLEAVRLPQPGLLLSIALFLALLLCGSAAVASLPEKALATSATSADVVVTDAQVLSSRAVIGDTSVEVQGADTIIANLGTMTMPGAYVELGVTVCNRGTSSATLASVTKGDCDLEDVEVRFPSLEAGETLDPGEACTFTLVVVWSADSVLQYEEEATGSFSLVLHYEGDATETPGEDGDSTDGGNDSSDGSDSSDGDGSSDTATEGPSGEDNSSNGVAESPSNGSDSSGSTTGTSSTGMGVQTGDDMNALVYLLTACAGLGLLTCLVARRRMQRR